jgi:hypothetical protein
LILYIGFLLPRYYVSDELLFLTCRKIIAAVGAQQAYAALGQEEALQHNAVKATILRMYNITEET